MIKKLFLETRPPFLLLPVVLGVQAAGITAYFGTVNWSYLLLSILGVVLAHMAVNVFNDWSDARTGIDDHTVRTPFSGGSGFIQAGTLSQSTVFIYGWVVSLAALAIGIYLCLQVGWHLLLYIGLGAFAVLFYTPLLARLMLGEIFAGAGLGSLVILGMVSVQGLEVNSSLVVIP